VIDNNDRAIINHLQGGFPLCERPYQVVAEHLGLTETEVLQRLQNLLDKKILSRFGPMYHAEKLGGGLTLAALKVPPARFDQVMAMVNAFPEVAHNYQREHELNMWFVLATETPQRILAVITEIEQQTGLKVYNLPKEREYFIGLKWEV
jgi:DNA-binding Lrp family transcriptional regulator